MDKHIVAIKHIEKNANMMYSYESLNSLMNKTIKYKSFIVCKNNKLSLKNIRNTCVIVSELSNRYISITLLNKLGELYNRVMTYDIWIKDDCSVLLQNNELKDSYVDNEIILLVFNKSIVIIDIIKNYVYLKNDINVNTIVFDKDDIMLKVIK